MLKLLQSLFGKKTVEVKPQAPVGVPSFNTDYVEKLEKKELEFHEEIRAQVDSQKKVSAEKKPAVKAKSNKGKKAPAKPKADAKKAPAKKPVKKSKEK